MNEINEWCVDNVLSSDLSIDKADAREELLVGGSVLFG